MPNSTGGSRSMASHTGSSAWAATTCPMRRSTPSTRWSTIRKSSTWASSFPSSRRTAERVRCARRCSSRECAAHRSGQRRCSMSTGPPFGTHWRAANAGLRWAIHRRLDRHNKATGGDMDTSKSKWIVVLTGAAVAAVAMPVPAQTTDLDQIVVTARKRDESFRNVPITVSVFTERAIQSAGIQKPGDFIAMIPNMTLVETQNAGNAFVVVRGISQARNSEPSVAVLVDGVLETNPAEFDQELFDISQIEVLKGPQGALYGRNAIGG